MKVLSADLHPITNSIIEQIEWARNNNSKSEWDDYGWEWMHGWWWYYHSINRIKELNRRNNLILKQLIDNYKKKYSLDVVGMILMSIDDLDDFKKKY
jgi:hypothetical protein